MFPLRTDGYISHRRRQTAPFSIPLPYSIRFLPPRSSSLSRPCWFQSGMTGQCRFYLTGEAYSAALLFLSSLLIRSADSADPRGRSDLFPPIRCLHTCCARSYRCCRHLLLQAARPHASLAPKASCPYTDNQKNRRSHYPPWYCLPLTKSGKRRVPYDLPIPIQRG